MSRETDARVAEKVMGWTKGYEDADMCYPEWWTNAEGNPENRLPEFSTSIADAWLVVEWMKADGWAWHIGGQYARSEKPWCSFRASSDPDNVVTLWAATAPEAICLAALAALSQGDA